MTRPLISVVMPVYNAEKYLIDAVASILEQDLSDWELICVDDGSSDASPAVLDWFAAQDQRIQVVHQPNSGIVHALNRGCGLAKAPLLCRVDADDIALPCRLRQQADFMRRNPHCSVVGGGILEVDADTDPLGVSRLPEDHARIVDNLLHRKTGLFHPTTMIRAAAFEAVGGYRAKYQWIEDHDLWLRIAQGGELANLPEVVLCYRQHAESVCWQRALQQRELMNQLMHEAHRLRNLRLDERLLLEPTLRPRSAAGPGKWARAASKGGYPLTARKHLARLAGSDAATSYKWRMSLESIARLALSVPGRLLAGSAGVGVPTFPTWHTEFERSGLRPSIGQAA